MSTNVWYEPAFDGPLSRRPPRPAAGAARSPRAWPPVLMRDYLARTASRARDASPAACLGQVIDFLGRRSDNVVAVIERGGVLGLVFDDTAVAAVREDGMQALDRPLAEIMQAAAWCCDGTDSPYVVAAELEARQLRRAPVAIGGRIAGAATRAGLRRFLGARG